MSDIDIPFTKEDIALRRRYFSIAQKVVDIMISEGMTIEDDNTSCTFSLIVETVWRNRIGKKDGRIRMAELMETLNQEQI